MPAALQDQDWSALFVLHNSSWDVAVLKFLIDFVGFAIL